MVKIINTGGTFNKVYDPVAGELVVPKSDEAVESALASLRVGMVVSISGVIYKDSLQMDESDRKLLYEEIVAAKESAVVVVHGTDTMERSASYIASTLGDDSKKRVIFTGAMVPYSIDPVEATSNLVLAVASAKFLEPGVYIAMHGSVLPHNKIAKNRTLGLFERVD